MEAKFVLVMCEYCQTQADADLCLLILAVVQALMNIAASTAAVGGPLYDQQEQAKQCHHISTDPPCPILELLAPLRSALLPMAGGITS